MHEYAKDLFTNIPLWAAFFCWCTAQGLKIVIDVVKTRSFDLRRFSSTGGMPSAHTATVCGLATSTGMASGFGSPVFAVAAVFALITMFDAATVRYATGQQARVLNEIIAELRKDRQVRAAKLKELLGHTRVEVLAGMALGVALSALLSAWWLPAVAACD